MAGKKYIGKPCAYCGAASDTEDHVVARKFFSNARRFDLIKVPACSRCNRLKSQLEHYAASVLPLGSNHPGSRELIPEQVNRRLARNKRLRRELSAGMMRLPDGTGRDSLVFPLDEQKLSTLFGFIGQGLLHYHYGVVLPPDSTVRADPLTQAGIVMVRDQLFGGTRGPIDCSIADGAFAYMGAQAHDNPTASIWLLSLYGGFGMKDKNSDSVAEIFGVFTGPQDIIKPQVEQ